MPTLLLIRHGENDFVKTSKLAGRLPNIHLNERGREQAAALAKNLGRLPLKAIYASPLERAVETAQPLAQSCQLNIIQDPALMDIDIGAWQGRSWKALSRTKAWKIVQHAPTRFTFPAGESFLGAQTRLVNAMEKILAAHKAKDVVAVVFHADPIKLVICHYLGLPLDRFQRLTIETGSTSLLQVNPMGAQLLKMNIMPPFEL
ncbi:MAG: histidine phosphatase family protein [Anaerolineales bacterium]|nr:histidine phosphatase family protein [Anaerolineales bacterium]